MVTHAVFSAAGEGSKNVQKVQQCCCIFSIIINHKLLAQLLHLRNVEPKRDIHGSNLHGK